MSFTSRSSDLHLVKTGLERGIDAGHHLMKFILAGNGLKLAGVQTVNADIQRGETGGAQGDNR